MKIINVTPHPLALIDSEINTVEIPPSGDVARVKSYRIPIGEVAGMTVDRVEFGAVEGLPGPSRDCIFVVSALVAGHKDVAEARSDVFSPGELIRDGEGRVIGARGLTTARASYLMATQG